MENYNTDVRDIEYGNDEEFRECMRVIFKMKPNIDQDPNYDEVTRDEMNYDFEAVSKSMDHIYDETKNHKLFQTIYDMAAAKMFSMDRSIGLAVLFSYDNFKVFHRSLCDFFNDENSFCETTESYITVFNTIK
jgi:hypothetical protein